MRRTSRAVPALLGLVTLCGLATACSATPDPSGSRSALDDFDATAISEATQTDHLGGYDISSAHRTVTVYRTASATADDLSTVAAVHLPAGFALRMKRVQRSWTALEHLEETLPSKLSPRLRALLGEVGIDAPANGLDVGLTRVEPDARAELQAVLGDSLATVFRSERVTAS